MSSADGRRVADVAEPAAAGAPGVVGGRVVARPPSRPGRSAWAHQVRHRAVEQDPALVEDHDPLAQGGHVLGLVGGDDHRRRLPGPAEHVAQPTALGRVEPGGRLVEDQQVRAPEQRLSQDDATSLAAGQGADPLGGDVGQPDEVDDTAYLVVPGREVAPLLEDRQVVDERERRETAGEAGLLGHVAEPTSYGDPAVGSSSGPLRGSAPSPGRPRARWPGSAAWWSCRRRWGRAAR